jgi:hypothetical protein
MPGAGRPRCLSQWALSLLQHGVAGLSHEDERMALVGQAKEVAARVVPLLGGPWGHAREKQTCQVRLAGWRTRCGEQGPTR